MVLEHGQERGSQWSAKCSIAAKIGCTPEALRSWARRAETDQGQRSGMTEGGLVRVFVGCDPAGIFLEWDTFLEVPEKRALPGYLP